MMHQEGLIDPTAQAETGDTFSKVWAPSTTGIMGNGNFNVAESKRENPELDMGDRLVRRR
jgi:hypothetical protein